MLLSKPFLSCEKRHWASDGKMTQTEMTSFCELADCNSETRMPTFKSPEGLADVQIRAADVQSESEDTTEAGRVDAEPVSPGSSNEEAVNRPAIARYDRGLQYIEQNKSTWSLRAPDSQGNQMINLCICAAQTLLKPFCTDGQA